MAKSETGRRRALFTLADQGLSSVSNFAIGVVVAKLTGPVGLGVFALAFASWLFLVTQHRALVTDPMAIEGDARTAGDTAGVREGLAAELIIGAAAGILFAVLGAGLYAAKQHAYGVALLATGPWLPALVVQDYWRWIGFMTALPRKSLVNDLVFNVVEGAALIVLFLTGIRSAPILIGAWGAGALAGALVGVPQFGLLPSHTAAGTGRTVGLKGFFAGGAGLLRRRWRLGRWIAGNDIIAWISNQGYVLIVGFTLGPAGLGGLKAAQQLVTGPSSVLIQASGSLGLPEASRGYDARGWAGLIRVGRFVSGVGLCAMGAMTVAVILVGRQLLSAVYRPEFAHLYWVAVMIGVAQTIQVSALGPILVMKVTRHTRYLMYTVSVNLPVMIGGVAVLCHLYGIDGAGFAALAVAVISAVGARWFQYRSHRSIRAGGQEPESNTEGMFVYDG